MPDMLNLSSSDPEDTLKIFTTLNGIKYPNVLDATFLATWSSQLNAIFPHRFSFRIPLDTSGLVFPVASQRDVGFGEELLL